MLLQHKQKTLYIRSLRQICQNDGKDHLKEYSNYPLLCRHTQTARLGTNLSCHQNVRCLSKRTNHRQPENNHGGLLRNEIRISLDLLSERERFVHRARNSSRKRSPTVCGLSAICACWRLNEVRIAWVSLSELTILTLIFSVSARDIPL